jgi:hypothetical protein
MRTERAVAGALASLLLLALAGNASALELGRSAFVSAGAHADRTISGYAVVGDPISGVSEAGVITLWHGFVGPLGLLTGAVPALDRGGAIALAPLAPNPSASRCAIRFRSAAGMPASVAVFDAQGRRVWLLASLPAGGEHEVVWSLDGEDGTPVGPGLYFIRLEAGGARFVRRAVVLR